MKDLRLLVRDVVSTGRTNDKKNAKRYASVIIAIILLNKNVQKVVEIEKKITEMDIDQKIIILKCLMGSNDNLAFLGHVNYRIHMMRHDLPRRLLQEYSHLYTSLHSQKNCLVMMYQHGSESNIQSMLVEFCYILNGFLKIGFCVFLSFNTSVKYRIYTYKRKQKVYTRKHL